MIVFYFHIFCLFRGSRVQGRNFSHKTFILVGCNFGRTQFCMKADLPEAECPAMSTGTPADCSISVRWRMDSCTMVGVNVTEDWAFRSLKNSDHMSNLWWDV